MNPTLTKRVEAIFLELVELPNSQRGPMLDERCGADLELRQRVQRLLDADALNTDDGTLGEALVEIAHDHIPRQVGAYTVRGQVGEGGMGAVFDAIHGSTRRRAALKLVRAGISTTRGRERLRIEAESLSRLSDPGIAQVYDAGVAEVVYPDGAKSFRPFIAMEFVEGLPIVQYVRQNKLSIEQCLRLVERVARAAHHAHQRGVIHRDLKPSNIIVTADGTPKIVDFGIARITDATIAPAADSLTVTGQVIGTVRYMSPEQASGDPSKVDTRTDVYAIGAILYELLAKRPLIDVTTGSTLGAVLQVLKISPPRLDTLVPDLHRDVVAIVHKAVEPEPEHRYGSALALADDLDQFLAGREVSARAPTTIERFVRVVKRNKPLSSAIAVAALAVIVGAGISTWQAFVANRNAHIAQREAIDKTKALNEAQAALDYLTELLGSATPEKMGRDARVIDVVTSGVADLENRLKDRPLVVSTVQLALGRTFMSLGRYREALKILNESYQTRLHLLGAEDRLTVDSELAQHEAALSVGEGAEIYLNYDHAPQWYEKHLGPEDRQTLRARAMRATAYSQFDDHESAIALLQSNYDTFRRVYGPEDPDTLEAAHMLGFYLVQRRGDAYGTVNLLRPVVEIETRKYGADNSRTLFSTLVLASAMNLVGNNQRAIELLEPRIPKFVEVFGEDHSHTVWAIRLLAIAYRDAGKLDKAESMFNRAIEDGRRAFGDHDGRTQSTRVRLAEMWLDHGRLDDAEKLIDDVLHRELKIGVAGGNYAITLTTRARVLMMRHRPQDALMHLEGAMGAVTCGVRGDHRSPQRADVAYWMGVCLLDLDRPADAAMCLREAVDTYTLRLGDAAPQTRRAREKLDVADRAVAQRSPAPTTQPVVGFGKRADEVTWFHCLALIAIQEHDLASAESSAGYALTSALRLDGGETDTSRELRQLQEQIKSQQAGQKP